MLFVVHHLLVQMAILRPGIYNDVNIQRNTVEGGYRNSVTHAELEVLQETVDSYPCLYFLRRFDKNGSFNRYR
jgi:hypothetical protein